MEDDIRKYRIVGVPQPLGHSANALFEVIGYIHSNGTYVPLTARVAEQVFAPKGKVFAYDFYQKYSELEGKAISFSVIEKKKSYTEGTYTNFVWDFSKDTKPFGYEAIMSITIVVWATASHVLGVASATVMYLMALRFNSTTNSSLPLPVFANLFFLSNTTDTFGYFIFQFFLTLNSR